MKEIERIKNSILNCLPDRKENPEGVGVFISERMYRDLVYYREVCENISPLEKLLYFNGFKIYIDPALEGEKFRICENMFFKEGK